MNLQTRWLTFGKYFLILACFLADTSTVLGQAVASCPPVVTEICNDMIDNDGDGLTDCADPQCFSNVLCAETLTCPVDVIYLTEEKPVGDGAVISDVWENNALGPAATFNVVDNQFASTDPDGFTLADGTPLPGHANPADAANDTDEIANLGFLDTDIDGSVISVDDGSEPAILATANGQEAAKQTTFLIIPPDADCIDFRVNPARDDNGRLYLGINSTSMEVVVGGTGTGGLTGSYEIPAGVQGVTASCGTFWPVVQARFYHVDRSAFSNTTVQWDLNDGEGFQDIDPIYFSSDLSAITFVENKRMVYRDADDVRLFEAGGIDRTEANALFCEPGSEDICVTDSGPFCECELQNANATVFGWNAFGNDATPGTMSVTNTCGNVDSDYTFGVTGNATMRTNANNLFIGNQGMAVGECSQVTLDMATAVAPKFYIRDIDVYENISITGTLNGVVVKPIILTRNRRSIVGVGVAADPSVAGSITAGATNLRALSRRNYAAASTINSVEVYFTAPIDQLVFDVCKTYNRSYNIFVSNFETCCENTIALCNDGADNDGDGVADCDDPKCLGLATGCFIPCPNPMPITNWNALTAPERATLQAGGTVTDFPTGFCNPDTGDAITVDITSSAAQYGPAADINTRLPRRVGTQSFLLARQTGGAGGVTYSYEFSDATQFRVDSRQHTVFNGNEVIVVEAFDDAGGPIDIAGQLNAAVGVAGPATVTQVASNVVRFDANGRRGRGLWWEAFDTGTGPKTVTVTYFRAGGNFAGAEPFRLAICGDVCPGYTPDLYTCDDPDVITRWAALTPAERVELQDADGDADGDGALVEGFDTGFCAEDGLPVTVDISAGPAPDAPNSTDLNNRQPRRWDNQHFMLGRQMSGTSGVEYCYTFEEPTAIKLDNRGHAFLARSETVVVTAFYGADPVNLTGIYEGAAGPATITGNGTNKVTFAANGKIGRGLRWEVSSNDAPITTICVQYFRTNPNEIPGAEPFRMFICPAKCIADEPEVCTNRFPIKRWNKLTVAERATLNNGGTVENFHTGYCDESGDPILIDIESSASDAGGVLNNRAPRRWKDRNFLNTRSMNGGQNGNKYCFTLSEATGIRVSSPDHNALNRTEDITVTAFFGDDPVNLSGGLNGNVGPATVTGSGTPSVTFDANGKVGRGLWWEASSGDAPVTTVCVDYSRSGAQGAEPFMLELCDAILCLDDDVEDLGLAKAIVAVDQDACGVIGNVEATIRMVLKNNSAVTVTNLELQDDLLAQLPITSIVGVNGVMIESSTATANPVLNAGYNGTTDIDLFNNTSGTLAPGQQVTVDIAVELIANQIPNMGFMNSAAAAGEAPDGTLVSGTSSNGANPDALTYEETPFWLPALNSSKALVFNQQLGAPVGNADATFEVSVINTGNVALTNVSLIENMEAQLGAAFVELSSQGSDWIASTATTDPILNAAFDGTAANADIFDGASGLLEPGQSATVSFVANIDPNAVGAIQPLLNQVTASGKGVSPVDGSLINEPFANQPLMAMDLSDSGNMANTNNTGFPGDTGCHDDPTPILLPGLNAVKAVTNQVSLGEGLFRVTYQIIVKNTGNTPITDVQLVDDFYNQMGGGFVGIVSGPSIVASTATANPQLNNAYDGGVTNANIFNGMSGVLEMNEMVTVNIVADINPGLALTNPVSNQAIVTANFPDPWGATQVVGTATDEGTDPEGPNSDPNPNAPTLLNVPVMTNGAESPNVDPYGNNPLDEYLNTNGGAVVTAADGCGPIVWTNNYDPANFIPTCGAYSGSITITFTATDQCGNAINTTGTLTIDDQTGPQCVKPEDLVVDCTNLADLDAWLADDWDAQDISEPVVITNDYDANDLTQYANGGLVTWTFTDACDNVTTRESILTVNADAPVFTSVPADYHVTCPEVPVFGMVEVNDPSATVTFEDVQLGLGCPTGYTVQRTWTATNACGSTTATQTITVEPGGTTITFTSVPSDITIDCDQFYEFGEVEAETTCAQGGLDITFEDEITSGDCDSPFTVIRTWTAVDACGGLAQATQTINTSADNTPPTFGNNPASIIADCGEAPVVPEAFDFCGAITLTHEDVVISGDCATGLVSNRTWTATDLCGNASTFSQMVTTNADNTAPVFTFVPYGQTYDCDEGYSFSDAVAVDACSNVTITFEDEFFGSDCSNGFGYDVYRTWTATDECGNTSTAGAAAWVIPGLNNGNTVAFLQQPEDLTVPCGTAVKLEAPAYRTLCREGATLSYSDEFMDMANGNLVQIRTWVVTDNCGNAAYVVQTVTYECKSIIENARTNNAEGIVLYQNTPNPFVNSTRITFELPEATVASLVIHDLNGKVVYNTKANFDAGMNTVVVDDFNASGVYYYTLTTGEYKATKKMVVLK